MFFLIFATICEPDDEHVWRCCVYSFVVIKKISGLMDRINFSTLDVLS